MMLKVTLILIFTCLSVQAQIIEKKVTIPSPKDGAERYFYIPFDVPENTKSLSVSFEYDKKDGANVLDLGVFDARFDKDKKTLQGFRGWSGGRRSTIFISEALKASHGYLPGKMTSGRWQVILGLYKVVPEGVEVSVKVKLNEIDPAAESELLKEKNTVYSLPPQTKMPAPAAFGGYKWFRGDLHIHTFYSDGNWTFPFVLDWARAVGLDFVGLTEHNTAAHHPEINLLAPKYKELLILRGEEVTTYGGHFNVWGLPNDEVIDFRITPKSTELLQKSLDRIHELGLLASINHPTGMCGGCSWSYGDWTRMDSVEIWNGSWDVQDENVIKLWDQLLQTGKRMTVIGSSDTHRPPALPSEYATNLPIGFPTNHAGMKNLSQSELLSAIRHGRIWISDETKDYELEFSAVGNGTKPVNIGDETTVLNNTIGLNLKAKNFPPASIVRIISNGETVFEEAINGIEYKFAKSLKIAKDAYFRVEIRTGRGADSKMTALTNPIFVKVKR